MKDSEKEIQVIIVDDNPDDAALILYCFKNLGFQEEVRHFIDGEVFLDFLNFENEDHIKFKIPNLKLLILDIKMPKVDGFTILKTIKSSTATKNIPVVMLSSSREERDIIKAYTLGASGYLVKALDYEDLIKTIGSVVNFWLIQNVAPNKIK